MDPADLAGLAFQDFPESVKKSQVIFIIVCGNALRHGVNEGGIPTIVPSTPLGPCFPVIPGGPWNTQRKDL